MITAQNGESLQYDAFVLHLAKCCWSFEVFHLQPGTLKLECGLSWFVLLSFLKMTRNEMEHEFQNLLKCYIENFSQGLHF